MKMKNKNSIKQKALPRILNQKTERIMYVELYVTRTYVYKSTRGKVVYRYTLGCKIRVKTFLL